MVADGFPNLTLRPDAGSRSLTRVVLDCVVLDVLERYETPLLIKAIEFGIWLLATPHGRKPPCEIGGIVDAAIHSHATERIVDVGSVADEKYSALSKRFGDPLVIATRAPFGASVAVDCNLDPRRILSDAHNGTVKLQFKIGMPAHLIVQNAVSFDCANCTR